MSLCLLDHVLFSRIHFMFDSKCLHRTYLKRRVDIKSIFIGLAACLLFFVFACYAISHPTDRLNKTPFSHRWNLHDVDILTYIQAVATETHRNIVVDDNVKGKVSIYSGKPISKASIYPTFLTVLKLHGYTAVTTGDITKVVPLPKSKTEGLPLAHAQGGDTMVVGLIPLANVSSISMVAALRDLMPPEGQLLALSQANTLVAAGPYQSVARIRELAEKIDKENNAAIEMMSLHYGSASDIVASIKQLLENDHSFTQQVTLTADDRSNSILLSGDKTKRFKMRALIAKLDSPGRGGDGTEVVYLKYQKAEEMVPILSAVAKSYFHREFNHSESVTTDMPGLASPVSESLNQKAQQFSTPSVKQRTSRQSQSVQSEPHTNALILTASPDLMRTLKGVIAKLDIRRAQVLVEAIIAEISDKNDKTLGVEWQELRKNGAFGAVSGGTEGALAKLQGAEGLNPLSQIAGGIALGFIRHGSISGVLQALSANMHANVLATPSIVALDNQPATISVVRTVPFDVGQYETQNVTSSISPYITTEYRPVGLQLHFTPQITQDNAVQLSVTQETGSVEKGSLPGKPTTNDRRIQTTVLVDDGDILVLGGLIDTQLQEQISKVPLLGEIPAVGKLFQTKTKTLEKRNLMIFIRPIILRDEKSNIVVTNDKYHFMQDQQILQQHNIQGNKNNFLLPETNNVTPKLPLPF